VLEAEDGPLQVGEELALGADAEDPLPLSEADEGGGVAQAVVVGDGLDAALESISLISFGRNLRMKHI
jgi:hypothetical protein